jgi:hypothetical protein
MFGNVILLKDHALTSTTSRAANAANKSAVTPAVRAFSVATTADHHSAGIQSRCHHLVTVPAEAPISEPMASLAPCASLGPQSSMTARNEVIFDMSTLLGQNVLKSKAVPSLDCGRSLGQNVPMVAIDEKESFKQEFIDRVRRARASTGKKQWEIALAMGVEQDEYKHWEAKRLMPHHLIARFCFACQVDPVWLLTGHGRMKGSPTPELVREEAAPAAKPRRQRAKRAAA